MAAAACCCSGVGVGIYPNRSSPGPQWRARPVVYCGGPASSAPHAAAVAAAATAAAAGVVCC